MTLERGGLRSCLIPLAGQPLRGLGQLGNPHHQARVADLVELMAPTGVIADVHPEEPVNDLHITVLAAIQTVRGTAATGYPTKVPHLTLGYAAEECDSDQVQRKLRNGVRPEHAPIRVDAIHLVDVAADVQAKTITWDHVATIPLGDSS